jgi:hypothetical protein
VVVFGLGLVDVETVVDVEEVFVVVKVDILVLVVVEVFVVEVRVVSMEVVSVVGTRASSRISVLFKPLPSFAQYT